MVLNSNVIKTGETKVPGVIGTFEGKCCDSNVFNNNDMKLGRELFEKLIASEEYRDAMSHNYYIGFLGHPSDPNCMDFRNACIVMRDMWMDDNGEVYAKFDLIDTPVGRVVKTFIDAGVEFGISIRGAGDIDNEGNVDPETFVFRGYDLVTFPAYSDCVPTFQAIAASTDIKKKATYKKICQVLNDNLESITSATTLESAQNMFKENSDEYKAISTRIDALKAVTGATETEDAIDLEPDKVKGMTNLYLAQVEANTQLEAKVKSLEDDLKKSKMQEYNTKVACSRKIKSFKRIVATQIKDITKELDSMESRYSKQIKANRELSNKIVSLESKNLEYSRKIEATSKTISQKDSTISDLEKNLHETVVASNQFKKQTSNLDEDNRMLQKRVEAAEQMVLKYQEAYANMYANALGIHIDNLSVTASTSVGDLQKLITSRVTSPECTSRTDDIDIQDVDTYDPGDGLLTM